MGRLVRRVMPQLKREMVETPERPEASLEKRQSNGHGLGCTADPFQMENLVLKTSLKGHLKSPVGPTRAGGSQRSSKRKQKR